MSSGASFSSCAIVASVDDLLSFRARNIGEKSQGLALNIASKKAVRILIPERINVAARAAYWNSPA
jgi:hypothetical protein